MVYSVMGYPEMDELLDVDVIDTPGKYLLMNSVSHYLVAKSDSFS